MLRLQWLSCYKPRSFLHHLCNNQLAIVVPLFKCVFRLPGRDHLDFPQLVQQILIIREVMPCSGQPRFQLIQTILTWKQDFRPITAEVTSADLSRMEDCLAPGDQARPLFLNFVNQVRELYTDHLILQALACLLIELLL